MAEQLVELSTATPIWDRFFLVAPLVLVATKERGGYDVAPKHLALPLGWGDHFGFVCTPEHATYRNVVAHPEFTVGFPRTEQILETSLAAAGRREDGTKPTLAAVATVPARVVDGVLVEGCWLQLECTLDRIVDGFGANALVVGKVVAAAAARDCLRAGEVDDADLLGDLGALVYLAPGRLAVVRDTYAFPFPAGFRR